MGNSLIGDGEHTRLSEVELDVNKILDHTFSGDDPSIFKAELNDAGFFGLTDLTIPVVVKIRKGRPVVVEEVSSLG